MHGSLASGVAAAYHTDVFILAESSFTGSCSVVQTNSNEPIFIGKTQSCVLNSRCANGGTSDNFCSVLEVANALAGWKLTFDAFAGDQYVGSKAAGLAPGAVSHFSTANAIGKSEIVFNFGAATCLSSNR